MSKEWYAIQVGKSVVSSEQLRFFFKESLVTREKRLSEALKEAIEMQSGMHEMQNWLTEAENTLSVASPMISRLPATLRKHIDEHAKFTVRMANSLLG